MNRRNVINADTEQSRFSGGRRTGSFPRDFDRTVQDAIQHETWKDDGKDSLNQGDDDQDDRL